MRHYQKKEILNIISLLYESHKVVRKCAETKKYENACFMLQECQKSAIDVGHLIEEIEGEDTAPVFHIEQYCEQLYQVNQEIDSREPYRFYKQLEKSLNAVEKSIKGDIECVKPEILFLPYKADMWTSLESIWKEAVSDEGCHVTVVVAPYYFLNLSTRETEFRYEADRFPSYVEIIHYDDYDIPLNHPDMIFIHNPYDSTNTLTKLPECYHSDHLKNHTDLLIYSPYGNFGAFNPVTHPFMCSVNALNYVDKVLVQSNKVKKLYMDCGMQESKLVVLGSPKTDAVVNGMKERNVLPDSWKDKLSGRKVILFSAHLSYLLREHQKAQKGNGDNYGVTVHKRVFERMNNSSEFAVIWRPHPLMKDMIKSRGIEYLLDFVEEVEELIRCSDNMVLDTSGDYLTAFQYSDAFLTTYTSLISEYMLTGKPVGIYERKYKFLEQSVQPVSYMHNYFMAAKGAKITSENVIYSEDFYRMILEERDPFKDERMKDVKKAFCHCDGTVGQKVWEQMKKELLY